MASSHLSQSPSETTGTELRDHDAESLLELLGDEYTQRVLSAIGDDAVTGRELIDRADVSKATAYRRLDDLQEAGLVESTLHIDPDGHHCEQYRLAVSRLAISFGPEGFDVAVEPGEHDAFTDRETQLLVRADD